MQMIKLLALIWVLVLSPSVSYSQSFSSEYDLDFIKWSGYYMPGHDYRVLKAQCIAESNLDPLAISHVGAMGICQFMPATWDETEQALKITGDPFNPSVNIQLSSYYMQKQLRFWTSPRPSFDRKSLALASYNAGAGHLAKAQRKCNMVVLYSEIIKCLPDVTGRHSKETIQYVERIWGYYINMVLGI